MASNIATQVDPTLGVITSLVGLGTLYMVFKDTIHRGFGELSARYADWSERAEPAYHAMPTVVRAETEMAHLDQMIEALKASSVRTCFRTCRRSWNCRRERLDLAAVDTRTALQRAMMEGTNVWPSDRQWVRIEYVLFNDAVTHALPNPHARRKSDDHADGHGHLRGIRLGTNLRGVSCARS